MRGGRGKQFLANIYRAPLKIGTSELARYVMTRIIGASIPAPASIPFMGGALVFPWVMNYRRWQKGGTSMRSKGVRTSIWAGRRGGGAMIFKYGTVTILGLRLAHQKGVKGFLARQSRGAGRDGGGEQFLARHLEILPGGST